MLEIGTELARVSGDGPSALRVVGIQGAAYVCQEIPFGQNVSYTPEELRLLYGAENPEIVVKSEVEYWREMSGKTLQRADARGKQIAQEANAETPEMVFSRQAREAEK